MSAEVDERDTNETLTKRFLFLRRKLMHFWNRWKKEYLLNLREQHRMTNNPPNNITKGDLVLLHDDNIKRVQWKMGIVEGLITVRDKEVRGVSIRVSNQGKIHLLTRPIQKVYPLEISNLFECDGKKDDMSGMIEKEEESNEKGHEIEDEKRSLGSQRPNACRS